VRGSGLVAARINLERARRSVGLILNRRHLERVLRVYVDHSNHRSPHRALNLRPPDPDDPPTRSTLGAIRRRDRLGVSSKYYPAAA